MPERHHTVERDAAGRITSVTVPDPEWAVKLTQVLELVLEREAVAKAQPYPQALPPIPEPASLLKRTEALIGKGAPGQQLGWRNGQMVWQWPAGHRPKKQQPTPGRYHGWDPVVAGVIQEVLKRLPEEVRAFVDTQCAFVPVPTGGTALGPARIPAGRWGLCLHTATIKTAEGPAVVAHEIAHAWRGDLTKSADTERATATLVRSWGFEGLAADPDHCAR